MSQFCFGQLDESKQRLKMVNKSFFILFAFCLWQCSLAVNPATEIIDLNGEKVKLYIEDDGYTLLPYPILSKASPGKCYFNYFSDRWSIPLHINFWSKQRIDSIRKALQTKKSKDFCAERNNFTTAFCKADIKVNAPQVNTFRLRWSNGELGSSSNGFEITTDWILQGTAGNVLPNVALFSIDAPETMNISIFNGKRSTTMNETICNTIVQSLKTVPAFAAQLSLDFEIRRSNTSKSRGDFFTLTYDELTRDPYVLSVLTLPTNGTIRYVRIDVVDKIAAWMAQWLTRNTLVSFRILNKLKRQVLNGLCDGITTPTSPKFAQKYAHPNEVPKNSQLFCILHSNLRRDPVIFKNFLRKEVMVTLVIEPDIRNRSDMSVTLPLAL